MAHIKITDSIPVNSNSGIVDKTGVIICLSRIIWDKSSDVVKIAFESYENELIVDTDALPLLKVINDNQVLDLNKDDIIKALIPIIRENLWRLKEINTEDLGLLNTAWAEVDDNSNPIEETRNTRVFFTWKQAALIAEAHTELVTLINQNGVPKVTDSHGKWLYFEYIDVEGTTIEDLLRLYGCVIQRRILSLELR